MSALLLLLVLLPLVVAALLLLLPRWQTQPVAVPVGLVTAVVTLLAAVGLLAGRPWAGADPVAEVDVAWVPTLGIRLHLLADGLSLPLVLLTCGLGVAVMVLLTRQVPEGGSARTLVALLLAVEGGALATFTAADLLLFFVAFEVVLVPMWAVVRWWGDPHDPAGRRDAAARFVLFTAAGSAAMLAGLVVVALAAGTTDVVALTTAHGSGLDHATQLAAAVLLLLGLAVKVPLWPLHTWLPAAHTAAPTVGSVLLAGVLLKMGTYGMVRFVVPVVPAGFAAVAPVLAALGVVGILWGGLACLVERDLKRLVAYSSVAHLGFVALGLASGTAAGLQGALFANVAHGAISALLFLVAGGLKDRGLAGLHAAAVPPLSPVSAARPGAGVVRPDPTAESGSRGGAGRGVGLRDGAPRLGGLLALGCVAGLGLPGLAGFWGELLAITGAWQGPADVGRDGDPGRVFWRVLAVLAALGTALAAAYLLRVLRLVWHGDASTPASTPATTPASTPASAAAGTRTAGRTPDASEVELAVGVPLVAVVVVLGLVPSLLLRMTEPAVHHLLEAVRGVV